MPGRLIQFHAMPSELASFARQVVDDFGLTLTAFLFPPGEIRAAHPNELRSIVGDPRCSGLAFTQGEPAQARSELEFLERNPSAVLLSVGRLEANRLEESCLSTTALPGLDLDLWARISKVLRSTTATGAYVRAPHSPAQTKERSRRFTSGAAQAYFSGTEMLGAAGASGVRFHFERGPDVKATRGRRGLK